MRKLPLVLTFIIGLTAFSCSDNQKKEQVNDETKEVEVQSHSMEKGLEEQGLETDEDLIDKESETNNDTIDDDRGNK